MAAPDDTFYALALDHDQEFMIKQRYRVIRKVGAGSYGTVVSAIDTHTKEFVAIKKCFRIFDRKLLTKRCLREIKLLRHLTGHTNIVGLKDIDIVNVASFNEIYLVLECCDTTMHDVIHANVPLEPVHYRWFMYQIFSALHYMHSANVLHRDLKPSNILVNENCSIRICDFGMARSLVPDASVGKVSAMTHYVVTRWYRAPEIMLSHQSYGKAIDMWSAGCILAELLGKRVLFKGTDYVDQLKRIIAILGLPEDTSFWDQGTTEGVMDYIRQLRNADGEPPAATSIDFAQLFPQCPEDGIDLLVSLLQLDPAKRLTATQAMHHAYVAEMRDPLDERTCPVDFDFDSFEHIQDEQMLRKAIIDEFMDIKRRNMPSAAIPTPTNREELATGAGAAQAPASRAIVATADPKKPAQAARSMNQDVLFPTAAAKHHQHIIHTQTNQPAATTRNPYLYQDAVLYASVQATPDEDMDTACLSPHKPTRRYTGSAISTPRSLNATEAQQQALAAMQMGHEIPLFHQVDAHPPTTIMGHHQFVGEPEDMDEDDRQAMHSDDSIQIDPHRRLLDPSAADVHAIERHLSLEW